jgi:hypothetical protein
VITRRSRRPGESAAPTPTPKGNCQSKGRGLRCAASRRLPPIGACGCIRDPFTDRHRCGGEISDRQLQGAVDAAHHILDAGYLPIFDVATLRELWKSGHHQLVDELRGGAR